MRRPHTCIKKLFDQQGTDKGKWFGGLYDVLLQPYRETIKCVVEVGIGTLIPHAPSSMVGWGLENYRPGGSLRAWRDFLPNAEIYGLDVALDTQFTDEHRIHTYLCDSTDRDQAEQFFNRIAPIRPDLVIDDGLHTVEAQIGTLRNFFPSLLPGGLYVIEDVSPEHTPMIVAGAVDVHTDCHFFVDSRPEPWVAIVIRKPV